MDLFVDDDGFVRAPALKVYRRLTNVAAWPHWWPGVRVEQLPDPERAPETDIEVDSDGAEAWQLRWRDRLLRIDLEAVVYGWRHETGFRMDLSGDVTGRAEFWLDPSFGGTVVHHVLVAQTDQRRPVRLLKGYRRVLRRGLWALKDHLQAEVRQDLELMP